MTRDEIRGLIGAYATGSLSADERKALFEAALDDQELFDDLAREQALKELLEQPGAKQRLIAALTPELTPEPEPRRTTAYWNNAWVWAAAGAFAVAVIAGIVLMRPAPVQQIARVELPALPSPPLAAPAPAAPSSAPAAPARKARATARPAPLVAPAAPAVQEPAAAAVLEPPAAPVAPPVAAIAPAAQALAAPAVPTPVRPPAPTTPPSRADAESVTVTAGASLLGTGIAPAPAAARADALTVAGTVGIVSGAAAARGGGGGRGGRGGAGPRAAAAATPARFAFDYSVTPQGVLRISPAANGFLTVGANNGSTTSVLVDSRALQAGSMTEIQLPAGCVSALVMFSARAVPRGLLNITGPMDPPSGAKSDPNPSPNSRLLAIIPAGLQR